MIQRLPIFSSALFKPIFFMLLFSGSCLIASSQATLTDLTVTDTGESLLVTVTGTNLSSTFQLFLNMDNDENTGFHNYVWDGMGVEIFVQDGSVNTFTGNSTSDGTAFAFSFTGNATVTDVGSTEKEITIAKSLLPTYDLLVGNTIKVGYVDTGSPNVKLPTTTLMMDYTLTSAPELIGMRITESADDIVITMTGTTFTTDYIIYFDMDGNNGNNFQSFLWPNGSGAELQIQNGFWGIAPGSDAAISSFAFSLVDTDLGGGITQRVITAPKLNISVGATSISVGYINAIGFSVDGQAQLPSSAAPFQSYTLGSHVLTSGVFTNGNPTLADDARIDENYTITEAISMKTLTVSEGVILTIADGASLTVDADIYNYGDILVSSGGSLITKSGNDLVGHAITIERNTRYINGRYSMVGSPVRSYYSITAADLGDPVYSYDETINYDTDAGVNRWVLKTSEVLSVGNGYAQATQEKISFKGTPNSGTVTVTGLTHTVAAADAAADRGWNLVSNPYPAAISITDFLGDNMNVDGTIAIWDDGGSPGGRGDNGDYLIVNGIGTSGPNGGSYNGFIGTAQAFFVRVSAETADASVVFEEDQRSAANNSDANFFRSAPDLSSVRLTLEGEFSNNILFGFREDATLGVDRMYDARKFAGNSNIAFYSYLEGSRFAIQGLPQTSESISLALGYDLKKSGDYTLLMEDTNGLPDNMELILVDHKLGKEHNLSTSSTVLLSLESGEEVKRFSLEFRMAAVLSSELASVQDLIIYEQNDLFNIILSDSEIDNINIEIMNLSGQSIRKLSNQKVERNLWSGALELSSSGVYILAISSNKGYFTKRFIY